MISTSHVWLRRSAKPMAIAAIPAVLFILLFIFYAGWTIWTSFTDLSLLGRKSINPSFVGFDNYIRLITRDGFLQSVWTTTVFTFFSAIVGQCGIGLLLAIIMKSSRFRLKSFVEFAILFGWLAPDVVAAFMWNAFASSDGMINVIILQPLGFESVNLLNEYAIEVVIISNIWKGTAWSYLLFSAALDTVSREVIEAAYMDGANALQRLRHVLLPLLRAQIATNLLFVTIWTYAFFSLIYALTGGGPGRETEVLSIYMYKQAFDVGKLGYGSAVAIAMMLIVGGLSIFYVRQNKDQTR
ncbi:binding-protein-dependent transport systems inner membrane component [Roseibium sp. TrichSKD4]|nr:binding-protein-dependent transport systems inner membrane component [Roseibium sp. TrichSKD4]